MSIVKCRTNVLGHVKQNLGFLGVKNYQSNLSNYGKNLYRIQFLSPRITNYKFELELHFFHDRGRTSVPILSEPDPEPLNYGSGLGYGLGYGLGSEAGTRAGFRSFKTQI